MYSSSTSTSPYRCTLKHENGTDDLESFPASKTRVIHVTDDMYQQLRTKIMDLEKEIEQLKNTALELLYPSQMTNLQTVQDGFYAQLSQGILTTLEKMALEDLQKNSALVTNLKATLTAAETWVSEAEWKLEESHKELQDLKTRHSVITDFASLQDYLEDHFNKMNISST
ncbi:hypothetical protein EDD85DRAFT_796359 [Armillaria nabsnona]|nr:hypothetical protein EDD85DRAFT_796359 [Armillaria nabsnona]